MKLERSRQKINHGKPCRPFKEHKEMEIKNK